MKDQFNNYELFVEDIVDLLYSTSIEQTTSETQDTTDKQNTNIDDETTKDNQEIEQVAEHSGEQEEQERIAEQEEQEEQNAEDHNQDEMQAEDESETDQYVVYSIDIDVDEIAYEDEEDNKMNEQRVELSGNEDQENATDNEDIEEFVDDTTQSGPYVIDGMQVLAELEDEELQRELKLEEEDQKEQMKEQAQEEQEQKEEQEIKQEQTVIPYYDFKGSLWRAIDFVVLGNKPNLESMGINGIMYNAAKRSLIAAALELRQALEKPITTVISEPVLEQTVKQVIESIKKILIFKYDNIKPVIEQQAINIVQKYADYVTQQQARDIALSHIVYRFALDSLLLGLTEEDVKKIRENELLKYALRDYLIAREDLFQILAPAV